MNRSKPKPAPNRDEEPPTTRQEKELAKQRKELQKLWDANGAAIYEANREYKAKYGKEMDAAARSKAIKDATMNGIFNAGAYASNLEAEKTRQNAQNQRMANKMTRFEKEEEARWQASQKVAEEKQKAEELQAGYAAYYAAMRQGVQEAQTNWWDKAVDFVQENIVEPIQNTWNTVTTFVQEKIVEPAITALDERFYQPYIKPAVEKIKLVTGEWVDTVVKLSVNQIAVPVKQSAPSAHLAKLTLAPALDDDPPTPWENFKEWLRIQFLTLDHPEYPPSDLGSGPHKSRDATVVDYLVERLFWLGEEKFRWYNHYDNAADHMDHYLNNSGKEYEVDVDEMLEELPQFKQEGDDLLQQLVQDALKNNYSGQKSEFDVKSDWVFRYAYETDNWFYAMNGHAYSIGVNVVVNPPRSPGDNPTVKVVYKVFVSDYYTWDMGKDTSFLKDGPFANIQLPDFSGTPYEGKIVDHGDVITIYDSALQELHKAGLAQEFHIGGETEKIVVEFEYNPTDGTLMPLEPDK